MGAIVPASMFMYGSIFIAVTLIPVILSSKPVEEAVNQNRIQAFKMQTRRSGHGEKTFVHSLITEKKERRTDDALPDTTDYTTANEYVLGHGCRMSRSETAQSLSCLTPGGETRLQFLVMSRRTCLFPTHLRQRFGPQESTLEKLFLGYCTFKLKRRDLHSIKTSQR